MMRMKTSEQNIEGAIEKNLRKVNQKEGDRGRREHGIKKRRRAS
jgi:hypothetical protein